MNRGMRMEISVYPLGTSDTVMRIVTVIKMDERR